MREYLVIEADKDNNITEHYFHGKKCGFKKALNFLWKKQRSIYNENLSKTVVLANIGNDNFYIDNSWNVYFNLTREEYEKHLDLISDYIYEKKLLHSAIEK